MREKLRKRVVLKPQKVTEYGMQLIAGLVLIELLTLLYMFCRGAGALFLQTMIVLVPFSVISCFLVLRYRANYLLVLFTILLVNFGFVAQYLTSDNPNADIKYTLYKYVFAFIAAYAAAYLFWKCSKLISSDIMVPIITIVQLALWAALVIAEVIQRLKAYISGEEVERQAAIINLSIGPISVQPMEVIKVLYVFVIVILLCKEECKEKKILGLPRDIYLILYTMILACCSLIISELGSFLVMLAVGGIMLVVYSCNRKGVLYAGGAAGVFLTLGWCVCRQLRSIGTFNKVYLRFSSFLTPETAGDAGYQGLQMRKGLTVAGLLGADERYMVTIPRANDDMIFANFVQQCGLLMGILMILAVFVVVYLGFQISQKVKDSYYSALAFAISILFATEAIVHISYNVGIFPITGVPLYLVSEGVTSMTTSLALIAILLLISTMALPERKMEDEEKVERNFRKMVRPLLPRRKRIQRKDKNQS